MKDKLRICATCHSKYDFCPRCDKDKNKELWHFTFCSENCKNIYDTASKYENGQISANEAKTLLDNLDLSKLNNFGESYKKSINRIMSSLSSSSSTKLDEDGSDETEVVKEEKVLKKSKNKRAKNDVEE